VGEGGVVGKGEKDVGPGRALGFLGVVAGDEKIAADQKAGQKAKKVFHRKIGSDIFIKMA
jgi:hypothetical protein